MAVFRRMRGTSPLGIALMPLALLVGFDTWINPCAAQSVDPGAYSSTAPVPFSAQIWGIIDTGIRHVGQASAAGALTQFASGLNTSRIGLRGTEDMGSDLRASLNLLSGFSPGTGTQANTALFDRAATAGLGWKAWDLKLGRMEGFGYEQAASGATDPLAMALNLPNYSSPAAAGSKAPVLGANPLQAVYTYTYGQLRFSNAVRVSYAGDSWAAGVIYALGGVAGSFDAESVRAAHLGWISGPARGEAVFQQSLDPHGNRSTLDVLAGSWTMDAWKFQAGFHDLLVDAGFNSSALGNGASSTGILGNSTTVSTVLASPTENFRFEVGDLGVTWKPTPAVPLSIVAYKTHTEGAGTGNSLALVALAKWYLNPRTALYLEADQANQSGRLAVKPVSTTTVATGFTAGINVHF
jgi:predicted porin